MSTLPSLLILVSVASGPEVEVFPERVNLRDERERMQLVVTAVRADETVDRTRSAEYETGDPAIVIVTPGGVVLPRGDGEAVVTVRTDGVELQVPVHVSLPERVQPVSFRFEVLPALSKQGCNSGPCHGAPSGKGGFRLSLRAFQPSLDRETLLHEHSSRRVNRANPEQSLLLLKPTGKVPHEGGLRLEEGGYVYSLLRGWISSGCPTDLNSPAVCTGIEVYPRSDSLFRLPEAKQQLCVRAKFADGSTRDISLLSVYSSSDETIATVDSAGRVIGHQRGDVAIVVRYLEHIESVHFTFVQDVDGFERKDEVAYNYVDKHVHAKLNQLQYEPADLCTDTEFIRRLYLDVLGRLPEVADVKAFLSSSDPERRQKLIDSSLDRHEYAEFWALKWGDILRLTRARLGEQGAFGFHRWLQHVLDTNMPYDTFVRQLLTASGSTYTNPAVNYFRASGDAEELMETTAQLFIGARLACAKCHNHPFERWTQNNYYGMSAFFNRVRKKNTSTPDEVVVWVESSGEVSHPDTGEIVKPWVPDVDASAGVIDVSATNDRREALVGWLTQKKNPFFGRVEVNRLWSHLMGRGIVEPFDDFRDSNPASIPPLLDALAQDFASHGFDRKHAIRTILRSRTYQRSSRASAFSEEDGKYFSHYRSRMLTAEQLHDAVGHLTGIGSNLGRLPGRSRAAQLPSPDLAKASGAKSFLKVFGQSPRQTVCECERSTQARLDQALQLLNGEFVHDALKHPQSRFRRMIAADRSNDEIVTELYLAAYCRYPTEQELAANMRYVTAKEDRAKAFEDVCWALLNSKEFLFQR